ncbi:MAG: YraN family protein [candidate division Zixibacteria bacterium]|nr:YraN family protein [candidate division Zixibacteria bacterium]
MARAGEELAARHLEGLGYEILARNWRSPQSRNELDIIARDASCLVFVEVKTARSLRFGHPVEWITTRKQKAIIRAAQAYLEALHPTAREFRFDAIAIAPPGVIGEHALTHVKAAFTLKDEWSA